MTWVNIGTASFAGVEMEIVSVSDSMQKRLARYQYPWRSGADLEDFGREPYSTTLQAIFEGESYESDLDDLIAAFRGKEKGLFIHPLFGQWNARIESLDVTHSSESRDFAAVNVTIVEDGIDQEIQPSIREAVAELQDQVNIDADEIIYESLSLQDEIEQSEAISLAQKAKDFAANVENLKDKIEEKADEIRDKVNKVSDAIETIRDVNRWPLVRSMRRTADSVRLLGDSVMRFGPRPSKKRVSAQQPLSTVVHALYGNADNLGEILARNRVKNPYKIEPGTELTVFTNANGRSR